MVVVGAILQGDFVEADMIDIEHAVRFDVVARMNKALVTERDIIQILSEFHAKQRGQLASVFDITYTLVPSLGERLLEMWVTRYIHRTTEHMIRSIRFRNFQERERFYRMFANPFCYFEIQEKSKVFVLASNLFRDIRYDAGRDEIEEIVFRALFEFGCTNYENAVKIASYAQMFRAHSDISKKLFRHEQLDPILQSERATASSVVNFVQAKMLAEAIREMNAH